ncbi:transglutaminase domain-containing protein [Clostridium sp.]|uniref:transglutaminase domain-containing protein n=1 Tax=Clostridium sp. TaxID=1506 RepID=UPI0026343FB4|nr:transglutaminase domain-containing protein [Clostridium sp.]
MNKKKLTILLASAAISIGFGGFINPPQSVEAKALVLEEPIKAVRLEALAKIHEFKNIKKNLKEEIMVKIKAAESEENIKKLLEEAQKIESSKHQVKYTIKYIDDTNKTELKSETKIYFANKNITEKGEKFKGYELISENVKTKTLNIDYNEPIEFHYKKIDINKFKENTTSEIRKMRNIKKSKKDNFMAKISSSTSEETIKEILEEAKKENASKHQVKYTIKYIDDTNNKELKSETKIYFANKNITEKAEKFKKYKLVSPKETQSKILSIDGDNVIEFHYKLYDDYISLDNFIKEKVDFEKPLDYENTNFTGKSEELKDYIIKNIYKNSYTIKFKASEKDKNNAYDTLFNKTTKASHVRYARNWETSKTNTDIKDVFEYTLKPSYLAVRSRQVETEEKIDKIIKKNKVTEMSDFEKAKFIHDYIINKATPAPGSWMTKEGNNVHETPALILDGKGVCEAYTMAFNRLAERAGLESIMVVGLYNPYLQNERYRKNIEKILYTPTFDRRINHSWNKVKIDGKWYNIDTYHDDFRFELASKERLLSKDQYGSIEFLKSDEHFKKSHKIWNPDYVEKSTNDYDLGKKYEMLTQFSE